MFATAFYCAKLSDFVHSCHTMQVTSGISVEQTEINNAAANSTTAAAFNMSEYLIWSISPWHLKGTSSLPEGLML